jgi:hypothetical protein
LIWSIRHRRSDERQSLIIATQTIFYVLFWWNIKDEQSTVAPSTFITGVLTLKVAPLTAGAPLLNLLDRRVGEVDARSGSHRKKGQQAQSGQSSQQDRKTAGPEDGGSSAISDASSCIADFYVKLSTPNSGLQEQMLRVVSAKQLEAADANTLTNVSELVNKLFDLG